MSLASRMETDTKAASTVQGISPGSLAQSLCSTDFIISEVSVKTRVSREH